MAFYLAAFARHDRNYRPSQEISSQNRWAEYFDDVDFIASSTDGQGERKAPGIAARFLELRRLFFHADVLDLDRAEFRAQYEGAAFSLDALRGAGHLAIDLVLDRLAGGEEFE